MSGLIGFECDACKKPFFVCKNTPQCIKDDKSEIAKYKKKGLEFKVITKDISKIESWCDCRKGKKML